MARTATCASIPIRLRKRNLSRPALLWAGRRSPTHFKLYWIAADGRRELLAADPDISCNQPVPWLRDRSRLSASLVDYRQTTGTCYLQDIYVGPGLAGVPRGTIKKLRVIALSYRAAGVGWSYNAGPAGDALVCTPISIGNGSWDVKIVLGEATVYEDGSAFFSVAGAHADLFPGAGRARSRGADDAELADLAARRERLVCRLPRVEE